jgi:hypothetical protein
LLIAMAEPFIFRLFLLLFAFYERATPVAQERNPTAPRVPAPSTSH